MAEQRLPAALMAWREALGSDYVTEDALALKQASTATFSTTARVAAILRPASTEQVQSCLRTATVHAVPMHPISAGRNWGLGSRVPVQTGSVLLDLSRMNRIVDFDETMAHITVEPGVTFRQVHDFLVAQKSSLFAAVIGGSADASLIGNALVRGDGVGPLRNRFDHACAMEVVLPNGECIHTGLACWPNASAALLHRAGLGPALDGLFAQSNLGVVTRMTFRLSPRPAFLQVFNLSLQGTGALVGALNAVRHMEQQNVLGDVGFTFWNRYKLIARQGAFPREPTRGNTPLHLDASGHPHWWANGAHYAASKGIGLAVRDFVHAALSPHGKLTVIDSDTHGDLLCGSVFLGVPTDENLVSTYWRKPGGASYRTAGLTADTALDPDRDGCGVLFICPVLPLRGDVVSTVLTQVEAMILAHGFEPNIGMHTEAGRCVMAYIAIMFDREIPGEDARAMACHDAVLSFLLQAGHYPFRPSLQALGQLPHPVDVTPSVWAAIKKVLDPSDILSPQIPNG